MAGLSRVREQHIAVFGESGSGKTVLVSSFYGAAQESTFLKSSMYTITAEDTGQGNRLHQNYLGMKNEAKAPEATRFAATPYRFSIKPKGHAEAKAARTRSFDAIRLVWHDYPGEWFEEEPSSPEESQRRIQTFRALLRSDVAVILVDGQKLLDYAGEEEKYLKSLIWSIRTGLLRLKDDLLDDGKPLPVFPRIWMVALSKADLHPELDVHAFRELVVQKAAGDVSDLHDAIQEFVQLPEALSVGDDFMLLSSARFQSAGIDVGTRVGLDLLLPVALLLPVERLADWLERLEIPRIWLDRLASNADAFAAVIVGAKAFRAALNKVPRVGSLLVAVAVPTVTAAMRRGGTELKKATAAAKAQQDYLTAVLAQFRLDLEQGAQDDVIVSRLR